MSTSIEDRLAINDLFVRYATALDGGDVDGIVSCFTEDGVLESPLVGVYAGRDGIRSFSERFSALNAKGVQLRHILTNLAVTVSGDQAHATCYLVNVLTQNGQSRMGPPGRYDCKLARVAGEWLFQHRLVVLDAEFKIEGI